MEKKKRGRPPKASQVKPAQKGKQPPKKKTVPKRTPKGQFLPGNKEGKKFEMGNKAAEIWTEQTISVLLTKIWDTVVKGYEGAGGNYVRANDIKTIQEVCLMHDIDSDMWSYWKDKFKDVPAVMRLIKKILNVLEARLIYSGSTMDIFVMKNHYGYADKRDTDVTSGGKPLPATMPLIQKIEVVHTEWKDDSSAEQEKDDEDTDE